MGGGYSIYGRVTDTDKYKIIYEDVQNPMPRFKHEVYAYSLARAHIAHKCIYLYSGYSRVAKALQTDKYLEVTFISELSAETWDETTEEIDNVQIQIPWIKNSFDRQWKSVHTENKLLRLYKQ